MIRLLIGILLLGIGQVASAELQFPKLTGRVVDDAGMISSDSERQLNDLLKAHETATTNQVAVVTLNDLQGYTIEEFGYQLGRHWGIGQKDKNNGVLFIIAKAERKIRIEVGYGLEGGLTDAVASNIIASVVSPRFKRGQIDDGVLEGTNAILLAIAGEYESKKHEQRAGGVPLPWPILLLVLIFFVLPAVFGLSRRGLWTGIALGSLAGRGGRGGGHGFGGGGGGFGGGGGSFGGGGASGGW